MFSKPVCRPIVKLFILTFLLIHALAQAQSVDWSKPPNSNVATNQSDSDDTAPKVAPSSISAFYSNAYSNGIHSNQLELFCQAPLETSPATVVGSISSVRISPDLSQLVVLGDGVLGRYTAFAFDKPYRLVVDFDSTSLGNVPSKIKLEKPPISEIRLDQLENRARLVIHFGDHPVPLYAIERQDNMVVIALGETLNHRPLRNSENIQDAQSKPQKRQTTWPEPAPLNKEAHRTVTQIPSPAPTRNSEVLPAPKTREESLQAQHAVKKAILSNDLLLIELQDPKNPSQTYHLAIDIDLKDQTLKSASLSSLNGKIKRFAMSEFTESSHSSNERVSEVRTQSVDPRKVGAPNTVFDNKPMENPKNSLKILPSVTSLFAPPASQATENPLKMEEFRLQFKN